MSSGRNQVSGSRGYACVLIIHYFLGQVFASSEMLMFTFAHQWGHTQEDFSASSPPIVAFNLQYEKDSVIPSLTTMRLLLLIGSTFFGYSNPQPTRIDTTSMMCISRNGYVTTNHRVVYQLFNTAP